MCGELTYKAKTTLSDDYLTTSEWPVNYNPATRTLRVRSSDVSLGTKITVTIFTYLEQYPDGMVETNTNEVSLVDICRQPTINAPPSVFPAPKYEYDSGATNNPTLEINYGPSPLNEFSLEEDRCSIKEITCVFILFFPPSPTFPSTSCELDLDGTTTTYDPATGSFSLTSNNKSTLPVGFYQLTVTALAGIVTNDVTKIIQVVDPCLTTPLTIVDPDHFKSKLTYYLGYPEETQTWTFAQLVTKPTAVDCGPY